MNSGKRREEEEEEEENSDNNDLEDGDSGLNRENDKEKTGEQDTDAVEMARARSPGGSADDFEGVTGDLD